MPQNNKSTVKSPFTPKPVVYAAWGLLAAALVAHFVPALETVALVLYAVGLIALCLLALTAPKKGTIAVPRVFLPMLAAAFLIVGCQIGMRPDESPLVWRSILLAILLLIPLMISEKQAAADINRGRFAARVFIAVGVLWMSCAFWLIATNSVFDADVGMSHISTVSQTRATSRYCYMDVVWDGRTLDFPVSKEDFSEIAAGDKVLVTEYDGFWGAPYYTWDYPRKPISTVTLLAWGLLALATAFDHIPSFRAAALILYAVDWLAIAIAATLTKRKQTLIIRPGMILPLFISTLLLFQRKIRMTMQPAATIWLVTACFMLLTLPMLLAAEKQVPDERADDEKYWGRAVILALVVLLSAHSWACLSNAAFDQSAGSAQTAYITEKWREKHKFSWDYHLRVAASGETESLTFQIGAGSYNRVSEGDNVTVTEHPGFWDAPYYTWESPQSP